MQIFLRKNKKRNREIKRTFCLWVGRVVGEEKQLQFSRDWSNDKALFFTTPQEPIAKVLFDQILDSWILLYTKN